MNELLKLLADNKISLRGGEYEGETMGIFRDISDPKLKHPIVCSFQVKPEDDAMSVKDFTRVFVMPAVLDIKQARVQWNIVGK